MVIETIFTTFLNVNHQYLRNTVVQIGSDIWIVGRETGYGPLSSCKHSCKTNLLNIGEQ